VGAALDKAAAKTTPAALAERNEGRKAGNPKVVSFFIILCSLF